MTKKSKEVIHEETIQEETVQEATTEKRIKPIEYEPLCKSLRTRICIPGSKEGIEVQIVDGVNGTILHEYHEQKECLREIFALLHNNLQMIREVSESIERISNGMQQYYE